MISKSFFLLIYISTIDLYKSLPKSKEMGKKGVVYSF